MMRNTKETVTRDHTPAMADVAGGSIPQPTTMGRWINRNSSMRRADWYRQTPAGVDIGGDHVLVANLQQVAAWFPHPHCEFPAADEFPWLVFVDDKAFAINEDGTRSIALTESLREHLPAMLVKCFTWQSDGAGDGTYLSMDGSLEDSRTEPW